MLNFAHFTLFPMFSTKMVQNDSEYPSLVISHFFQCFSTKVVQNNLECSILIVSIFFQSFLTKVGPKRFRTPNFGYFTLFPIVSHQNGPKRFRTPNFGHFTLFQLFPTKVVKNDSEHPILVISHFSNHFSPKWSKMIQNTQFWSFHTFPIFCHQSRPK